MTPSRGRESQPLRSKKLQALLLLIAGVRVWLGCVLESGRGCQPPFPAGGTYLPLAKGEQVATNIKVLSNVVDCEDVRADAIVLAALAAADKAARVALLGSRRRSEADSTDGVLRAVYYACIARVLRLYLPRIMRVSCAVVYYACIGVYRCVSVCYHLPDTYYLGRPGRNTCITLYYARITRVSTRINASSV